jgi:c-di-GMP-binding flagellar brake protein YcgR
MDHRVTLTAGGRSLEGVSIDLSEGGMRFLLGGAAAVGADREGAGAENAGADAQVATEPQLEVGSVHQVTVWWDDRDNVIAKGEVIRHFPREDKREEVSIRFIGLSEKMEDVIRARVFARLRDLRARGVL